jgi:hypothetical protein
MAPKSHEPTSRPSCNPTAGRLVENSLKSARKNKYWLSLDPVSNCTISGPIQELSKLVAVATVGMAMAEAEDPHPFSEGVLLERDQKIWVAGRVNEEWFLN